MDVIFTRTRHFYQSYTDFWRLVELSGFKTCFVDEMDLAQETVYITAPINGEFRPHIEQRRAQLQQEGKTQKAVLIWWNLERVDSGDWKLDDIGKGASNDIDGIKEHVDLVWSSDRWYAALDRRMTFVVFGSHPELARTCTSGGAKRYDLCHLSYVTHRRSEIYGALSRNFDIAPTGWDEERHQILCGSRAMLNVHQTPAPIGEPLRFALAAAYKLPLLTENINDPYPLVSGQSCLMAAHSDMVKSVKEWLKSVDLPTFGSNLHEALVVQTSFRKGVEEALKEVGL